MRSWARFWTMRYQITKRAATSEGPGVGCWEQKQRAPCTQHPPKVWANCLSHSFSPMTLGYPHPIEVTPLLGNKQGNLLLVFAPSCCGRSPSKALPEFLVWPLVHLYWLGKAKNPDQGHHEGHRPVRPCLPKNGLDSSGMESFLPGNHDGPG